MYLHVHSYASLLKYECVIQESSVCKFRLNITFIICDEIWVAKTKCAVYSEAKVLYTVTRSQNLLPEVHLVCPLQKSCGNPETSLCE